MLVVRIKLRKENSQPFNFVILRYLNDRFVSVNIGVPPIDTIVRVSSKELLPALDRAFPMDTFQISYVPQAIRSFVHHFYPAYESAVASYAAKVAKQEGKKKEAAEKAKRDVPASDESASRLSRSPLQKPKMDPVV